MIQEEEHRIPGERAETVTGRRIDQNPVLKRGAVALAVVAFIGFALWSTTGKKAQDEDPGGYRGHDGQGKLLRDRGVITVQKRYGRYLGGVKDASQRPRGDLDTSG